MPSFDLRRGVDIQRHELIDAFARVLDSGQVILGPEVTAFENEFAAFVHAPYAIGTSSGTDSLVVALQSLGVGQPCRLAGNRREPAEVITVANGPVPTISAIRAVGAMPRLVDIDDQSLQISLAEVEAAITPRTRCVLPIHLYGYPAPAAELAKLCRDRGLALIEDCAQAHGTLVDGRSAGLHGDIGCFSFYPTKNLGALGDAGLCITRDEALADRMRQTACYGFKRDRVAHIEGLNCRLDELQAALLRVRLNYLRDALLRRQQIAGIYSDGLADTGLRLPSIPPGGTSAWHQYVIRVRQRPRWLEWFSQRGIEVAIHYASPIHLMPAYRFLGLRPGSLPVTERACQQVISLPMFPELTDQEVARVIAAIQAGIRVGLV